MKTLQPTGEWQDILLWCPSQCYLDVITDDGTKYQLYLRWRWDDPWQGHIIKTELSEDHFSPDLFELYGTLFTDEQLPAAKEKILELATKYINENTL